MFYFAFPLNCPSHSVQQLVRNTFIIARRCGALVGCLACMALYRHVSDCLTFVAASVFLHITVFFLLKSECKAIPHWRVCLDHTEWL